MDSSPTEAAFPAISPALETELARMCYSTSNLGVMALGLRVPWALDMMKWKRTRMSERMDALSMLLQTWYEAHRGD